MQAIEQDLWALFAPVGDILELAILRSQGRSKGCAFLTYASRQQVRAGRQPPVALGARGGAARQARPMRVQGLCLHRPAACMHASHRPTSSLPCPSTNLPPACFPVPCLQAQAAIQAFNGRQVGPSKRLVVKFADQKA